MGNLTTAKLLQPVSSNTELEAACPLLRGLSLEFILELGLLSQISLSHWQFPLQSLPINLAWFQRFCLNGQANRKDKCPGLGREWWETVLGCGPAGWVITGENGMQLFRALKWPRMYEFNLSVLGTHGTFGYTASEKWSLSPTSLTVETSTGKSFESRGWKFTRGITFSMGYWYGLVRNRNLCPPMYPGLWRWRNDYV